MSMRPPASRRVRTPAIALALLVIVQSGPGGLWILSWRGKRARYARCRLTPCRRRVSHNTLDAADGAHRLHRHFRRTLDQDVKIGSRRPVTLRHRKEGTDRASSLRSDERSRVPAMFTCSGGHQRCASTTCDLDLPARSPRRPKNCIEERGGGGAGGRAAGARPVSWSPPIEPGAHRPAPPELPAHERPVEDECSGLCPRRRAEVLDPPPSPSPSPCPQPRRISAALTPRTNPRTPPPATSPNDLRNDQLGDGPEVHSATVPGARKRGSTDPIQSHKDRRRSLPKDHSAETRPPQTTPAATRT